MRPDRGVGCLRKMGRLDRDGGGLRKNGSGLSGTYEAWRDLECLRGTE